MARHKQGKFLAGLGGTLAALVVAMGLIVVPITPAPSASAVSCPATVTITPLHSAKLYWDKKGSDNVTGAYLGYKITNTSGADITSVSVTTDVGTTSNLVVKRGGGQPATESIGTLTNNQSGYAYFLVDLKQGAGSQAVVTTLDYNASSCTLGETLSTASKRALAANANKIYSAEVVANVAGTDGTAPAIVKQGSYATVVVTGNTGTIGSGPDANREINLTPVVYPGLFGADSWKLVDIQFLSGSSACGSSGLISNRLHISNATTPSSDSCGGLYSASFTFKSRNADDNAVSQVQAFSYIASGNLIKHTSPYGSTIGLPTVNNTTGTATSAPVVNLSQTLSAAISSGAVGFTLDEVSFVAYQSESKTGNTLTFLGGTGPITSVCLVNPVNSSECGNGPYNVNNLKEDETLGTSVAGSFELVTVNSEPRIRFTASSTYYIGGANSTDLPARILMRAVDSSPTPQTSEAFANGTVLQGAAPTSVGDTQSGPVDTPLTLNVSSSGSSVTKCIFSVLPMPEPCSATSVSSNGAWLLNGNGTVTFTPTSGYNGTTTIYFGVTDQFGATSYSALVATITNATIYTLSFSANDANATGSAPSNITGNGNVELPSKGTLAVDGKEFIGWGLTSTATTPVASTFNLTETRSLYAIWVAAPTLTFSGNSPDSGNVPSSITGSGDLVLPPNSGSLAKAGNIFGGWRIDAVTYQPGETFNLTVDKTAVAVWIPQFTITFYDGSSESGSVPGQVTGNGTVSLPGNSGSLVRSGFTFLGWATSASSTSPLPTSYNLTADVDLYAVWQAVVQNNPVPVVQESDPCVPITSASISGGYVELGLIGVLSELWVAGVELVSNAANSVYNFAIGNAFVASVADNQVAMVNLAIDPDTYLDMLASSNVYKTLAKAGPKVPTEEDQLTNADYTLQPGSDPNSVEVTSPSGEPLELVGIQSIDLNLYAEFTGAELNNPKVWQDLGYGMMCWKLEPFSDTWFYLPNPVVPPGVTGGDWYYSNIVVKAGSITADPTTFQANTLFPSPKGGEMVWADVNGNGIYDPGGKTGDKAISHVVLCANQLSALTPSPSATPTESSTPSQTPTVTVTPTPTPTVTVTPTTPVPTATTPVPTATTPVPTATTPVPTATTPAPLGSPEPTTTPCSTPTVAPPSTPPTPMILIKILSTPTPTPSESPSESPSPSPTPTASPSGSATPSPTPTQTITPAPTPSTSPSQSPSASPTPSNSASPTPTPSVSPTEGPTPGPTATPAGPAPTPVADPNPPTVCEPSEDYGVAMKLTNGITTSCYRVTTASFLSIAAFGGYGFLTDAEETGAVESELADTGFDVSHWLVVALLLMAAGGSILVYARRRA